MQKDLVSRKKKAPMAHLKHFRLLVSILISTLALYLAGCATTKLGPVTKPSHPPKGGEAGAVQQVEDLNPEALPDSIFEVQEKSALPAEELPSASAEEQSTEEAGQEVLVEKPGYRVQIAALSNQDEAMQIKKEAMLKFADQGVYLIFDPPFYKIRVGDFVSRYDAEKLQQQAIQLGYKDAWIVRTRVKVRKTE